MDIIGFILADLFYIISFLFFKKSNSNKGFYFLILGLLFHSFSIYGRWAHTGYPPFFSLYEIMIFFSWSVVFLAITTGFHKIIGTAVPAMALLILGGVCFLNPGLGDALPAQLRTVLFPIHVSSCMLGYGAFFISFLCGIGFIKTNSIVYDSVSFRAIGFGLVCFSAGIIIGSIWAKQAWGNYWSWDPKETAALVTWIIYASLFFIRMFLHWELKRLAFLTIFSFFFVGFAWFGINRFFRGHHSVYQKSQIPEVRLLQHNMIK